MDDRQSSSRRRPQTGLFFTHRWSRTAGCTLPYSEPGRVNRPQRHRAGNACWPNTVSSPSGLPWLPPPLSRPFFTMAQTPGPSTVWAAGSHGGGGASKGAVGLRGMCSPAPHRNQPRVVCRGGRSPCLGYELTLLCCLVGGWCCSRTEGSSGEDALKAWRAGRHQPMNGDNAPNDGSCVSDCGAECRPSVWGREADRSAKLLAPELSFGGLSNRRQSLLIAAAAARSLNRCASRSDLRRCVGILACKGERCSGNL